MAGPIHEVRDPIYGFIQFTSAERAVMDSRPVQRLRYIHQLALTYLVYPGTTHRRFEHSLGVMDLAARVFDAITREDKLSDEIKSLLPDLQDEFKRVYWKRVLRMAALCHDIGHVAFSHAAEKELLPEGWDHERMTEHLVLSDDMKQIWKDVKLDPEDIAKLAVESKEGEAVSDWEAILREIISGDAFGVDRMDYLLRDSYHAGVAYGRFDYHRIINTLRILTVAPTDMTAKEKSREPAIGVEKGGLEAAESLAIARYLMFSQVYFHKIRRIYDLHLLDFLRQWLPEGKFSVELEPHLNMSDDVVLSGMRTAGADSSKSGHIPALRILNRKHFKVVYEPTLENKKVTTQANAAVGTAVEYEFGIHNVRVDSVSKKSSGVEFPVLEADGTVASSVSLSPILSQVPIPKSECVYVNPEIHSDAEEWIGRNIDSVLEEWREAEE